MFAYCLNNPVNMIDVTGEIPRYIVTDVETTKDEENPNLFWTTITYKDNLGTSLFGAIFSRKKAVTYSYTISEGMIQMSNEENNSWLLLYDQFSKTLAKEMMKQAKLINSDALAGRTINGIAFELSSHAFLNKFTKIESVRKTDMGGAEPNGYGYDYNADWFERPLRNIGKIIKKLLGNCETHPQN